MKILIYGATGATGKEIVKRALEQGHAVTAFVRNPKKLNVNSSHLAVVQGDLNDRQGIEQTMQGQDAVISALGASNMFKYDTAVVTGIQTILKAMEIKKVHRFIYLSFAGVSESRNKAGFIIKYVAPKILSTEIARHENTEKLIIDSNLNWTIVRAATLTNNKFTGNFRKGESIVSGSFMASISRADVADFMIQQLTDTSFVRKAPMVLK